MLCLFWRSVLHGYRRKESEQLTLPFGTLIGAETSATNDKRFTSYDRSEIAGGLDYAVNRNYNSGQSRFTQVDPIGMASASIGDPQSMNLFAYVQNNPIDYIDPSGLNMSGCSAEYSYGQCGGDQGFWGGILSGNPSYGGGGGGGGSFGDHIAYDRQTLGDLPPHLQRQVSQYLEYVSNAQAGNGFVSNEEASRNMARTFAIHYAMFDDGSYYTYFEIRVTIGRTDIQNFLDGFRSVGEPALPILEAIQLPHYLLLEYLEKGCWQL